MEMERRVPHSRYLILTATEMLGAHSAANSYVTGHVFNAAVSIIRPLRPAKLFPVQRAVTLAFLGILLWSGAMALFAAWPRGRASLQGFAVNGATLSGLDVRIVPPEYTALSEITQSNPAQIEALRGSRIVISAAGDAAAVRYSTVSDSGDASGDGRGAFVIELQAEADGYIALEPIDSRGVAGSSRLIGLTVTPDNLPLSRVTAPGRDLFLPDAGRTIGVSVEAQDDLALASLKLVFTRVSGSGEQFTFSDGEVPLDITRVDGKRWTAAGSWPLGQLGLSQGDMLVYRAVATDTRPNAPRSESDSFIIEIAGPGALVTGGFSIDEEHDRYAVSQQMVILKSERLLASRAQLSAESFRDSALNIAAEQRKVRAEFIFMMGGELADIVEADVAGTGDLDEHAHAAADDEAIAGRLANQGRLDLIRAMRSMSQAAAALNDSDVSRALVDERAALAHLQRAFSRTRYILRTLTEREALDLSRRLSGNLGTAVSASAPAAEARVTARADSLRRALADLASLSSSPGDGPRHAALGAIAARVLRVDPASGLLRKVAAHLSNARIDSAASALAAAIRGDLSPASARAPRIRSSRLAGSLLDELRRAPGGGGE
jgi:hypothetical protein